MDNKQELTGIQFLRGFCALGVVVGHCAGMLAMPKYGSFNILDGVLESGDLGVDIFFVISGFIMAVVVLQGAALAPRVQLGMFAWRRFIRILPMMWLAIISYAILQKMFARDVVEWSPYFRAFFLIPFSFVKPDVIWTLRQELIFYSVFALSFFGPKWARWSMIIWVFSPIFFLLSLGSIWKTTAYLNSLGSIVCSTVNLEFGAGLALGILWLRRVPETNLRLPMHPFWVLGLGTVAIVVGAWVMGLVSQSLPSVIFMSVSGAMIVALAARSHCPTGWLTSFGRVMGDASYAIYLFHLHILAGLLAIRAKLHIIENGPLAFIIVVSVAIFVTTLIHRYVERPLTGWLRERFIQPRPRNSQSLPV